MCLIYNTLEGCMFLALQTLNVSQILYPHTFWLDPKKEAWTHTAPLRGTGIPKWRNRQAHAMLKHSIDIALKISSLLKSASSLLWDVLRTNMLYIKAKSQVTAQSPLFSYVTFAKLAKSLKTPIYKTRNPALSYDKTGLKAIRKEKINRFSPGLTCVRPLHGNNICHPT